MASSDLTVLRSIVEVTKGVTPDDSVKATGTLTASALADTETVTINGKVYTLQTALTEVDGHVKIGADLTATLVNLKNAINRLGGVVGTDYATATTAHPTVEATASDATTLTVRARNGGLAGNALTTTEGSVTAAWGAATLTGGTNSTITALKQVRYTGESLNYNIENVKSAEITPTRVDTDLIQVSAAASGDINFELSYGSFDDYIEAVFCGTWTSDVLQNGTVLRTFTFQKHFPDMTVPQFHTFKGCAIEGMSLKMEIGKLVEGSFSVMAFGLAVGTAQIAGATFPAVSTTQPMNAVTNVQDFSIDGVPYTGCISSLSVDMKNNIRAIMCIGSIEARDMKLGTLEVTGDMNFYFNEGTNYAAFVAGTEFSFTFNLVDLDGNLYAFDFSRVKFESGEVVAGGKNSDVMFNAKWRGLYDGTDARVLQLTRTPV